MQRGAGNAAVAQALSGPKLLRDEPAAAPPAPAPPAPAADLTEPEAIAEVPKLPSTVQSGGVGIKGPRLGVADQQKHFLRAGRDFFGTNRETLAWFGAVRKAAVPGDIHLHESAAARLESVATRLGKDMPSSTIGFAFRSAFGPASKFSRRDPHMLALAIDYDPADNPRLSRQTTADLIKAVTGGQSSADLGPGARKTIMEMGEASAAGRDAEATVKGASGVLTKIKSESDRLQKVSEDFQASLGKGREPFLQLQKDYFAATDQKAKDAVMAKVPAVVQPWIDAVKKALKEIADAARAAGLDPDNLPDAADVRKMVAQRTAAKKDADKLAAKYKTKEPDAASADVAKIAAHEAALKVSPTAGASFADRCAELAKAADAQGSVLGPVVDAKARTGRMKAVEEQLGKPEFLFGASTAQVVSGPSMAQLVEHGFYNPEEPDPKKGAGGNFNAKFIQEMARDGFYGGFAFGGESTDSMHFEFVISKTLN